MINGISHSKSLGLIDNWHMHTSSFFFLFILNHITAQCIQQQNEMMKPNILQEK